MSQIYGGYQDWPARAGRFRSPGDRQIDFRTIFSRLTAYGYVGCAALAWECYFRKCRDGAREGAAFIRGHIIRVTDRSFDAANRAEWDSAQSAAVHGLGSARRPAPP